MADNGFKFYLNNSLLKTVESICPSMCHIQSNWSPSNYNFSFPVTSKNNTLLIKAYSDQMIYWAKIYSASVSIETTSKQFTDTIRANFDNFNSKLSIPINIKNYDDINISNVENYYCNGNSLTFQPHIYNYKIAYWRVVKSIEIEISGQADDYAQVIVNNSITVHPNLQDTLGIKDGIYIWGKTQSSDYVKEKHPFTMTNENLNIQFGTVNTLPTVCFLKASLKIRLFFQFTGTINVLSNKNSVSLKVKRLEYFHFRSALPSGACGQTASLNKSFELSPYIKAGLIKSITVTSNFDDYGSASINGITVGSCNLGGYHSCYDQTQTSVIDKSNLKNINSLSAYASSWNDPFGACASNGNGTGVNVTIKINYY